MSLLRELLTEAVRRGASDVHLKAHQPPLFRVHANLEDARPEPLTPEQLKDFVRELVPAHLQASIDHKHELDFSYRLEEVGRFRVNVFQSQGLPAVAMRHVKSKIPGFEDLHLPPILQKLAEVPRGIVLATGTTGSGKSTTLASMIQHINVHFKRRIITVEDPIEYEFEDAQSSISQREIGLDTVSFHTALKFMLRQDPDVIMVGEMRDAESFTAALAASETGHLVLTTLHTDTASQTLSRILNFFPHTERDQVRMSLANNLKAVICQRLIPAIRGGVVPATEIMINTPTVRKLIEKNSLEVLAAAIETGEADGMQTFNQAIYKMIKSGQITEEEGMARAGNVEQLRMNLKGIFLDESKRILAT
ncbi:MAG: PilT/PilU family type 4a pilus ATPase [Kiritimatiellae bacterium]|nr:PilT/PilU family type 4a pilus ATPase [Kiritimatiellia bacterium]